MPWRGVREYELCQPDWGVGHFLSHITSMMRDGDVGVAGGVCPRRGCRRQPAPPASTWRRLRAVCSPFQKYSNEGDWRGVSISTV